MPNTITTTAAAMRAGDTYVDRSDTCWVVRNVGVPDDEGLVTIRLAAGRSQAAFPEVFRADESVRVYRDTAQ